MKENKQPILSICIPTWNRRYSLQYTLKSIIDQDEFKSWDVEIVISDNASTDETEVEVWKLCKEYKNIRYFRNKENIWSNPNINKVLSLWEWEYLWLLGSDDCISKNALKIMINTIKITPKIILCKRYSSWENNIGIINNINDNVFGFKSFIDLLKKETNKQDIDVFFTFMSIICFEKKYFNDSLKLLINQYWENMLSLHSFNFSFIWFSNLKEIDLISIIESPRLIKVNSDVGRKPNMKIWNDLKLEMEFFIKKYSLNRREKKILTNIYRPWRIMCILYPIRQCLNKMGLLWIYNKLSKIYRKLRGYI